jgi:hypothetical protein
MPARPSHIPHAIERTALQKMSAIRGLSPDQLHPAGTQTIARMLAKGWIERQSDGRTYCITPAGDAALRTPIPSRRYSPVVRQGE